MSHLCEHVTSFLTPLVSINVGIPELMALAKMLWSNAFGAAASLPALISDWLSLPVVELMPLPTQDWASPPGDCIVGL